MGELAALLTVAGVLRPRRAAFLLVLILAGAVALGACDAGSSSDASSEPSAPASSPADDPSPTASPAAGGDAGSQALCAALINAVAAGTPWQLGEAQPGARNVGGMSVPSCEVGAAEGDPQSRLTVAYLPAVKGLGGPQLLTGVCKAVVGAPALAADGRSCAAPTQPPTEPGTELQRADLMTKDVGVLVLSFSSDEPSYLATSVDDLAAVGQAMARDPLLAMAIR